MINSMVQNGYKEGKDEGERVIGRRQKKTFQLMEMDKVFVL